MLHLDLSNSEHQWLAVQLIVEYYQFTELVDTRENIEAPLAQLSPIGQRINGILHADFGCRTRADVDRFEEDNLPVLKAIELLAIRPDYLALLNEADPEWVGLNGQNKG
jgi:hypothetical protein